MNNIFFSLLILYSITNIKYVKSQFDMSQSHQIAILILSNQYSIKDKIYIES